jgi:CxxC motif-containing protein (DUF1111 family)
VVDGVTKPNPNLNTRLGTASEMSSDTINFAAFAQLLAPPTPATSTASQNNGMALFNQVGCALCHSPTLVTNQKNGSGANTTFAALGGVTIHPFSDYAVHHMGSTLADGISQGSAGPDEFRTAPLWGVGQRIFFLHDGRTSDLMDAIAAHASPGNCATTQTGPQPVSTTQNQSCGSEANQVIEAFNKLSESQQQDILNFLRSL